MWWVKNAKTKNECTRILPSVYLPATPRSFGFWLIHGKELERAYMYQTSKLIGVRIDFPDIGVVSITIDLQPTLALNTATPMELRNI